VILLVYLILGIYFLNLAFTFVTVPAVIPNIEKWVFVAGGVLLIFGGVSYWQKHKDSY